MSTYKTRDMGFAGYLVCAGYQKLPSIKEGGVVYFVFEDDGSVNDQYNEYKIGGATVVANKYNDILKTLKKDVKDLMSL